MDNRSMDELLSKLIKNERDTYEEFCKNIVIFLEVYDKQMTIAELNKDYLREKLWKKLFHYLRDYSHLDDSHHFLAALRILSRDKTNLNELITDDALNIILQNASLTKICEEKQISYTTVTIESLKLLYNLLYNSVKVQQSEVIASCLPYLIARVESYNNDVPHDVKLFDMGILFLITALNTSTKNIINDIRGDACLIKILEEFVTQNKDNETVAVQTEEIEILCEALKVLFNLYFDNVDSVAMKDLEKYRNLELILSKLLTFKYAQQQENLKSFVINLLTVLPIRPPTAIIQSTESKNARDNRIMYKDADMSAICVLLKFLDRRLDCKTNVVEKISPVLTALIILVKAESIIREYVRFQILPPLKDVMNRPEEGTTMRAKLCKLLSSPFTHLRDLAAELLFVLCKKNVGRMVKYTGYGNAAGMLAEKGLLGRGQTDTYSDSEDSETEEYLVYKEQINPVLGCYEPPKSNPFEGMTEEQKEYEALQLVNRIDKLLREGRVRPCRIGDDGKPEPMEHVLQLQK